MDHFSRPRTLNIDSQEVLLKVTEQARSFKLELKALSQENQRDPVELEVKISHKLLAAKFKGELEFLLNSVRYNQ